MKKKKIIRLLGLVSFFSLLLFIYALSYGANYKMICDDLDQVGGRGSSASYKLMVSAGGQPSPIGIGSSTHYKLIAGYVGATFVQRGDANADGIIDISDVVYLLNYLFIRGPEPIPLEAGDATCDGIVDASDIVYLENYLFIAGPLPCDP
jgi:hypothetical protein